MSVEDLNVIDIISVSRDTNEVTLTISDHLDWSNVREHSLLLQEKINAYLRFIESGELQTKYPPSIGRRPIILVVSKFQPDEGAQVFLQKVSVILENAGITFHIQVGLKNMDSFGTPPG